MQEKKYDSLLNVSIIILVVSTIMLGITGYNLFFKKDNAAASSPAVKNEDTRDSLRKVYSHTIQSMDNNLQASGIAAAKNNIAGLTELSNLRLEIDSLLRQHGSEADLAIAKTKIEELQKRVSELESRYSNAENENRRLQAFINKLIVTEKDPGVISIVEPENKRSLPGSSPEKNSGGIVAGLHLFAVTNIQTNEKETNSSEQAEKIVGSFLVKNTVAKTGGEVVIVVVQPDGKVIKNSVWESGSFDTNEGKKLYSRKIYFDPSGDEKQLNFSLTPERFLKGDYTMQIWYNGNMVGKMVKTLS